MPEQEKRSLQPLHCYYGGRPIDGSGTNHGSVDSARHGSPARRAVATLARYCPCLTKQLLRNPKETFTLRHDLLRDSGQQDSPSAAMDITRRREEVEVLFYSLPATLHISFINIYSLEQYSRPPSRYR
jgi:hypothetical protein